MCTHKSVLRETVRRNLAAWAGATHFSCHLSQCCTLNTCSPETPSISASALAQTHTRLNDRRRPVPQINALHCGINCVTKESGGADVVWEVVRDVIYTGERVLGKRVKPPAASGGKPTPLTSNTGSEGGARRCRSNPGWIH